MQWLEVQIICAMGHGKCLILQAYLHVQWLEFLHIRAYWLCSTFSAQPHICRGGRPSITDKMVRVRLQMYGALEEGEGSTPVATPLAGASGSTPRRDLTAAIEAAPQAPQSLDPKGRM